MLINRPDNGQIGGGGGILLVAGSSGVFSLHAILITVVLAAVSLAIWLIAADFLK